MKQLLTAFVGVSSFMLFFLVLSAEARAGVLKPVYQRASADQFVDWEYAQKVWFEMRARDAAMAEYNKYRDAFELWLKKMTRNAYIPAADIKRFKEYTGDDALQRKRGFDIQLAYDQWFDEVYQKWFNGYPAQAMAGTARTFDQVLAEFAKRPACVPQRYLDECGPVPDWRSDEWKAKEREMMRKADEAAAQARRKR